MEVKLDKQYPLDVDADRAWALLSDLKATAECMPGAQILEQLSDTSYKGAVKIKVGPAVAQFGGTVDVIETSAETKTVVLRGKGADKGGSSASMDLSAAIAVDPANANHCVLNGSAAVIVNGKFAQFGGRMMVQVSEMILAQFVENFRQTALTLPTAGDASASAPAPAPDGADGAPAAPVTPASPRVAVDKEINGLSIVWSLVKSWWQGIFGASR